MIRIERGTPPQNTVMDKNKEAEYQKIEAQIEQGNSKSIEFKKLWTNPKVKKFLRDSQYNKCCYCEVDRRTIDSNVEHFRPKGKVKENSKHPGYWWLAYEWDNLLIACSTCNTSFKREQFPLLDEGNRIFNKEDLKDEEPYLINPLEEDPEDFIEYEVPKVDIENEEPFTVKAIGKCERGEKTVNELTGINSEETMLERAKKIKECEEILQAYKELGNDEKYRRRVNKYISPTEEFSGFMRFYFEKRGYISE